MKMYREQVLKEPAGPALVQIGGAPVKKEKQELVGISGD
jgi:hypothetical protein